MSQNPNPFVRGYDGLSIQRLLAISYDDDCPLTYLPLHPSQSHLPDGQVERRACIFSDDFVLITEDQAVPDELEAQCRSHGLARNVVYAVMAQEEGKPLHVGDTYSDEAAREVVRRLRHETGFYSRCWEISSGHLDAEAHRFLAENLRLEQFFKPIEIGLGQWIRVHGLFLGNGRMIAQFRAHRTWPLPPLRIGIRHSPRIAGSGHACRTAARRHDYARRHLHQGSSCHACNADRCPRR